MRSSRRTRLAAWAAAAFWLLVAPLYAGESSGTIQSTRLYTPPDPTARGGIAAKLTLPAQPLLDAFAVPTHDFKRVYRATVEGNGMAFRFHGLPVGKYDLLLLYEDRYYEGFTLSRDADTLTERDRASIRDTIGRSVLFFDTKDVARCAGTPGAEGTARCVLQELRTGKILAQSGEELRGYQIRSLKLAMLRDVGKVGWQLVETRELVRTEVSPSMRKGLLKHHHHARLGGIRVTDTVKDLGTLNLDRQ